MGFLVDLLHLLHLQILLDFLLQEKYQMQMLPDHLYLHLL
tara:strand:+ start:416 stop:535 length:120 start_codon:yes stop_codon:yes gene_type:complete